MGDVSYAFRPTSLCPLTASSAGNKTSAPTIANPTTMMPEIEIVRSTISGKTNKAASETATVNPETRIAWPAVFIVRARASSTLRP